MTTPLATIADALIEFILSLLNDPEAAAEYDANPEAALASAGLAECTAEDVRAVAPIIVDRPDVHPTPHPNPPGPGPKPPVEKEIWNIANNFHIDNRATIVDQSVNQNIWAKGDVNQIFDQEANVASGDESVAAGDDASVDNSTTDVTVGDVAVGNDTTNVDITDSFDDESTNTDTDTTVVADESFNNDASTDTDTTVVADESFNDVVVEETDTSYDYDNSGNIASDDAVVYTEETDQP